ncbi:MAG: hypothetical protein H6739_00610 [Alphaproteobacteria bacterium]|nr:hypothetical protein [Alphaproteobacteria bacterium]
MWLTLVGAALAGTFGDPGRADIGVSVDVRGDGYGQDLVAEGCEGESCYAWATSRQLRLRVEGRPLPALSVWAEAGGGHTRIISAAHDGPGLGWGAGAHLSWPRDGVRPALSVAARGQQMSAEDRSTHALLDVDVAAFAVVGSQEDQLLAWAGPAAVVAQRQTVDQLADGVAVTLSPRFPVGLVGGAELLSASLGPPWSTRAPALSVGVEVRAVDRWGVGSWVGVVW